MAKFNNVNYNNLDYPDQNPFATGLKEGIETSKNMATAAYDKTKASFLDNYLIELEGKMLPEEGSEVITDGKINEAFFSIDNFTPEKIIKHAKKMAPKFGLNPNAITKADIEPHLKGMRDHAVLRRMKMLRKWGNMNGQGNLQYILNSDPRFKDFYQEHEDAYAGAGLPDPIGREQSLPGGWKFTSTGEVSDIPWVADLGGPAEVMHDDIGAYVPYGWFGEKKYLPEAYKNLQFNKKYK
jgi:hypothetical protein